MAGFVGMAEVLNSSNLPDDEVLSFGNSDDAGILWSTDDPNANAWMFQLPTGGAVNVPVAIFGIGIDGVDLGMFNGFTQPTLAVVDADRDSYVSFRYSADDVAVVEMRLTAGGTVRQHTIPDVASSTFAVLGAAQTWTAVQTFNTTAQSTNTAGWALVDEAASATNPTLIPNQASLNSGIGASASGRVSIIASGVHVLQAISTEFNTLVDMTLSNGLELRANSGVIGISVSPGPIALGSLGTLVAPYQATTDAAFTDALGGDLNGAFGFNRDTDTGPTDTLEARLNGAWVSVALTGAIFSNKLQFAQASGALHHPNQIVQGEPWDWKGQTLRTYIDESRCIECGDPIEVGHAALFYANRQREDGMHAIYAHLHGNRDFRGAVKEALQDSEFKDWLREEVLSAA